MNEKLVVKTLILYLLKLYLLFKLLSLACLVFKFIVLCCCGGHRLGCPVSTVAYSGCWMEITSRNRVERMVINTFFPFEVVAILGKRACQKKKQKKMKLPRWLPWGVGLSTPPGGNALICAVNVAMSAESV